MKTLLGIVIIVAVVFFVAQLRAAPPVEDSTAEIVKALNFQNQQLKRIADSLEVLSGQKPGRK